MLFNTSPLRVSFNTQRSSSFRVFFFNDTATTEIYTLSLHDALPISTPPTIRWTPCRTTASRWSIARRSEEHTSELQSQSNLVCRLLLEKKKSFSSYFILHLKKTTIIKFNNYTIFDMLFCGFFFLMI